MKYYKKKNKHYIVFDYDTSIMDYNSYNKMIADCKNWYKMKIKSIEDDYSELLNGNENPLYISRRHRNIVIELIKKVLNYYPIIKTFDFGVFISNSFARGGNLINSDFDINFVYEDDYKDIGIQIEEQVNYALTQIVEKYRDFVHDSILFYSTPTPLFIDFDKEDDLIFRTVWDNDQDEYEITKGNEILMIRYSYGVRNKQARIDYLLSYVNEKYINEWVYYQTILFGNKYIETIFNKIKEKEKTIVESNNSKKTFNNLIEEIKDSFSKEILTYEKTDFKDMKNVKNFFKNKSYNKIYTFISLLKRRMIFNGYDLDFDDVLTTLLNEKIKKELNLEENDLKNLFNYFGYIMNLNQNCNKYGIGFRTRYSFEIPNSFNDYYNSNCNEIDVNWIEFHKQKSAELYKHLILLLDKLKME